jgi:hypothetical protein
MDLNQHDEVELTDWWTEAEINLAAERNEHGGYGFAFGVMIGVIITFAVVVVLSVISK